MSCQKAGKSRGSKSIYCTLHVNIEYFQNPCCGISCNISPWQHWWVCIKKCNFIFKRNLCMLSNGFGDKSWLYIAWMHIGNIIFFSPFFKIFSKEYQKVNRQTQFYSLLLCIQSLTHVLLLLCNHISRCMNLLIPKNLLTEAWRLCFQKCAQSLRSVTRRDPSQWISVKMVTVQCCTNIYIYSGAMAPLLIELFLLLVS